MSGRIIILCSCFCNVINSKHGVHHMHMLSHYFHKGNIIYHISKEHVLFSLSFWIKSMFSHQLSINICSDSCSYVHQEGKVEQRIRQLHIWSLSSPQKWRIFNNLKGRVLHLDFYELSRRFPQKANLLACSIDFTLGPGHEAWVAEEGLSPLLYPLKCLFLKQFSSSWSEEARHGAWKWTGCPKIICTISVRD